MSASELLALIALCLSAASLAISIGLLAEMDEGAELGVAEPLTALVSGAAAGIPDLRLPLGIGPAWRFGQ